MATARKATAKKPARKAPVRKAPVRKPPARQAAPAQPAASKPATRTAPVAKAAAPAPSVFVPVRTLVPAAPAKAAPAAKPAKGDKADKAKKPKLVRDSFTIPKGEYMVLDVLKQRAARLGHPAKKSELLRAGVKALQAMSDAAFLACVGTVPSIKTGRPAKS